MPRRRRPSIRWWELDADDVRAAPLPERTEEYGSAYNARRPVPSRLSMGTDWPTVINQK